MRVVAERRSEAGEQPVPLDRAPAGQVLVADDPQLRAATAHPAGWAE